MRSFYLTNKRHSKKNKNKTVTDEWMEDEDEVLADEVMKVW